MAETMTKNILEVDTVTSIDKTDKVLVNDNNTLKQVSVETLVSSGIPNQYVTESELNGKGYATTTAMNSGLNGKIDKNQGSGNSGKYLSVGSDGNVTLVDAPSPGGGITEETDPTVPAWAKNPTKPTYTADEVGALPDDTEIPTKTSDLTNDSGFITDEDIPEKLPNPQKIIFTGAVSGEYDGSSQQTINIPTGGTGGGISVDYDAEQQAIVFSESSSSGSTEDNPVDISNVCFANAGSHNSIYRGKSFGSTVTEEQWSAISAGTFDDLYIGDYWTIGGVNWRIAAFDYYYNCGDPNFTKHHAVIVPDTNLYSYKMNDTNITTGAYVGSLMYTEGLEQAKTIINNAFDSEHVLSHKIYLSNATSNGRASAGAWVDSTVDLMCEHMVYGCGIFSPVSDGSSIPNNYRVEKGQLPLFALEPSRITNRSYWWLRDVISSAYFACVGSGGCAYYSGASNALGLRPAFCIGI